MTDRFHTFDEWWATVECNETRERHTRFCGAPVHLLREAFEAGRNSHYLCDEVSGMYKVLEISEKLNAEERQSPHSQESK